MRITDSLLYSNTNSNYQRSMKDLYDVNNQIASGSKIQNSYEDSSIYVDTMRLNNEISTLDQVKEGTSKAQSFADNTDSTLNQMDDALIQFKTKLIQAANTTNSSTSLNAIANDLQAEADHLKSIANTSIDGQFLFSGSALDEKPISNDGTYNGNGENMTTLIGSNSSLPYNIDGESLFLGEDSEYSKAVSTNIKLKSSDNESGILQTDSTIEDLISSNGGGNAGASTAYFYIQGKNSDGSAFKNKIGISSSDSVENLLNGIKNSYSPSDSVSVNLNDYGQIEIKDKNSGRKSLDFSMVGSYDNVNDIDNLTNVVSFVGSNFTQSPDASSEELSFDRNYFAVDGNMLSSNVSQIDNSTNSYATDETKLVDASGKTSLDGEKLYLRLDNINGTTQNNVQIDLNSSGSTFSLDGGTTNYNIYDANGNPVDANKMTYGQLNDVISMVVSNNIPATTNSKDDYDSAVVDAKYSVDVSLDYKGRLQIEDKLNSSTNIKFSMYDSSSDDFSSNDGNSLSFMSNNAITTDEPNIDFFKDLDDIIQSVREGKFSMDSSSGDPRNLGIENSIAKIDHISDHVTKQHTKIGSYSNALKSANERADFLSLNTTSIKSKVADVDLGEAYTEFTQLSNSYQAMLSTIAKINSMSLLNYM